MRFIALIVFFQSVFIYLYEYSVSEINRSTKNILLFKCLLCNPEWYNIYIYPPTLYKEDFSCQYMSTVVKSAVRSLKSSQRPAAGMRRWNARNAAARKQRGYFQYSESAVPPAEVKATDLPAAGEDYKTRPGSGRKLEAVQGKGTHRLSVAS